MKTIKELLILLQGHYNTCSYVGLCNTMNSLCDSGKITYEEWKFLFEYIRKNKPSQTLHAAFFYNSSSCFPYWWPTKNTVDQDFVQIRNNYLTYLIENDFT